MKSPAFQLFVRDILCSKTVSKLHAKSYTKANKTARGVNVLLYLMCASWLEEPTGTLPDSNEELAALSRVSVEEFEAIRPLIEHVFHKDTSSDRLVFARVHLEAQRQAKRKQSGSKGGSARVANIEANFKQTSSNAQAPPQASASIAEAIANADDSFPFSGVVEEGDSELPTESQAVAMCMVCGIPDEFIKFVYADWFTRGGRDGANIRVPIMRYAKKRWEREGVQWRKGKHRGRSVELERVENLLVKEL